jgi:ADP-heptose:LPS heptosyltransferase
LAQSCDFIDEVMVDYGENALLLAKQIKKAKIDVSITLFSTTRLAVAQFLAHIPMRIAPATKIAQLFYTHRIVQRRSEVKMAEFEYNLALIRPLFPRVALDFPQPLFQFDNHVFDQFCHTHHITKPLIAFHPGSGGSTEANWTLREYIELVTLVLEHSNSDIVITFGPDEDRLCAEAKGYLGKSRVIVYQSKGSLLEFAALLSHFKLFISTSTGTYHLASAVGCETFTFFGDSLFASVARWKSIGEEKKQHPFMIPLDPTGRAMMFLKVKEELKNRLSEGF